MKDKLKHVPLVLCVLALGAYGINRSLWLDEVWVANSVREPTWSGMFYYSGWLQTTPPLFLALARAAAACFGLSNAALRTVPLALALVAVSAMLAVAWRSVASRFAFLAAALLAFHPTAIEYWRSFKQYSGEAAAAAVLLIASVAYLQKPGRRSFGRLLAAVLITAPLAYPMAFFLPGVALAVYCSGARARAALLAALGSAWFLVLYLVFLRPNVSPQLRAFWAVDQDARITAGVVIALLFAAAAAVRAVLPILRAKAGWREWTQIVCLLPCLLLAASAAAGWYPISPRTRLFLLPGFLLVLVMIAEDLLRRSSWWRIEMTAIACLIAAAAVQAISGQSFDQPVENLSAAVQFLRQRVGPEDLILVHPSVQEGFRFYSALDGWKSPPAIYGGTGWPCCARGHDARPGVSTAPAVREDLKRIIPPHFTGRIWLFYTTRPTHWDYVGLDEGNLWRNTIWKSGCPPGPYFDFHNVAVSPMECSGAGYTVGGER